MLPAGWGASLLAVDGSLTNHVLEQLSRLPRNATHLIVSAGGNDAISAQEVLMRQARTVAEALAALAEKVEDFHINYGRMLDAVRATGKAVVACTVYDAVPGLRRESRTGLSLFNDIITRHAFRTGVPLLDLRRVCRDAGDYSRLSPIEPSRQGGERIAHALASLLATHDFNRRGCVAYPLPG
jgi:lysophospholipase L1-like esterase